jgi:hypothetical protein
MGIETSMSISHLLWVNGAQAPGERAGHGLPCGWCRMAELDTVPSQLFFVSNGKKTGRRTWTATVSRSSVGVAWTT